MQSARRHQEIREDEFSRRDLARSEHEIEVITVRQGGERPAERGRPRILPRADHPARARIEAALRTGGYANYGGDWQCPACRCRVGSKSHADLSLRLELDGDSVRLRCSHGCRENTIRAMLGMAAYVEDPSLEPGRPRGPRH